MSTEGLRERVRTTGGAFCGQPCEACDRDIDAFLRAVADAVREEHGCDGDCPADVIAHWIENGGSYSRRGGS